MRPKHMLRKSRPVQLGVGALMLAIPASAVALTAGQADTQGAIPITLSPHRLAFGQYRHGQRQAVAQRRWAGARSCSLPRRVGRGWRFVAATHVRGDGSFRFVSPITRSGLVRVVRPAATLAPRAPQPGVATDSVTSRGTPSACP